MSLLGDGMFGVTIAFQVLAIADGPRAVSAVAAVWALSQLLLLPVGGWVADHVPRRTVVVAADLWRGSALAVLGVLSVTGRLQLWHVLVIGACFGAGNAFFNPASTSLLPDVLPDALLGRANAFFGGARPFMRYVVGPLVGGLVYSVAGPGVVFLVDAGTFAVSALLLALVRAGAARRPAEGRAGGSQLREVVGGLRVVAANRWLWIGMLGVAASALAFHGPYEVLVPTLLVQTTGSEASATATFSLLLAASGVGSILTSTVVLRRDLPRRFLRAYYLGEAAGLAVLVLIGISTARWMLVLAGLLVGAMFALTETVWTTTLQRHVPRDVLGRVSSVDWMAGIGLSPLSLVLAGVLGEAYGPRPVLIVAGALGALVLVALSAVPGARDPERQPLPGPAAVPGAPGGVHPTPAAPTSER